MKPSEEDIVKVIATNRKAKHEYYIIQTYEAGISLIGTEVKSLRQGKINFVDSYATVKNGEVWLHSANISEFSHGNINNHQPVRDRKLLLNKNEIRKLISKTQEKGLTLIPISFYFKNGKVKVELGVCKGKKLYDKRETLAKKEFQRDQERRFK